MECIRHGIVKKCCFCVNLKIGASIVVLCHIIPYTMHLTFVSEPESVRFYLACGGLGIYTIFAVLHLFGVWIFKKTVLQLPLLIYYFISIVLLDVMIALPGDQYEKMFTRGQRLPVEIAGVAFFTCLDLYFYCILFSLYISMRRNELDAVDVEHQ